MDYLEFRQSLAHSCITVNGTELYHHGVKNQKWGIRNALWYPIANWKNALKRKPKKQADVEKAKVEKENGDLPDGAHDGKTPQERVKDAVMKSGDLNLVMQNKDLFTAQELTDIANRYKAETTIKNLIKYEQQNGSGIAKAVGFIDKYSKYIGTVADAINTASKINNSLKGVASAYADYTEIQNNGGYVKNEMIKRQNEKNKKQQEEFEAQRKKYEDKQSEMQKKINELNKARSEVEKNRSEVEKNKVIADAIRQKAEKDAEKNRQNKEVFEKFMREWEEEQRRRRGSRSSSSSTNALSLYSGNTVDGDWWEV